MGKKVKKKARSGPKEKRASTLSQKTITQQSIPSTETVDDGVSVMKERKVCPHLDKGIDFDKVSSRIRSIEPIRCEDCREGAIDRRASKGSSKQGKKKGGGSIDTKSKSKAIWICSGCGHISCGGVGFPTTPQSHAVRHARQTRHPLAIQFENLQLRWCFLCSTIIPVEECSEKKDLWTDIVKLIKGRSSQGVSADVEDVWFGSGSIVNEIKLENITPSSFDGKSGYVVRGLVNLGNTCFFNSIMQNLLAMDRFRDHFLEVDESMGPLSVSLKKLFIETSQVSGFKNVINPRSFFGCICARAPQFRGYQQHDSHELLRCVLDGLCTEELSAKKKTTSRENGVSTKLGTTFVDAIFGGQLSSTVSCLECGHSSTVFEPFLDLSLPVPTKKPTLKKAPPISRAKKPKLPPKRSGRVRPKVNRDVEKVGNDLVDSTVVESVGPSTVADKKSSASSNLLTGKDNKKKPLNVADKAEDSSDNSAWLDYLGPNPVSNDDDMASKTNDNAVIYDSGQKDAVQDEVSLGNLTWMDYLEPGTPSDDLDMASKDRNPSIIQDSGGKDAVQNDIFLQNELPQKEETSTCENLSGESEVASAAFGCEPDTLDFDGFGDLFNEPETDVGPNLKSSSSNTNIQTNEIAEAGFVVGNSSESDPDEVDNSDTPVSIESCLAFFIKPELLSNEHAWHCENCSKTLQEQRKQSKRRPHKVTSNTQISGAHNRVQSAASSSTEDCPCPSELRCLNNGDTTKDILNRYDESLVSCNKRIDGDQTHDNEAFQQKERNGEVNGALVEVSKSFSSYKTCNEASISGEATDSCSVKEPSNAGCDTDEVQQRKSQLLPKGSESEGSDNDMNSDSMKVKRDATKRILINRVPPILTIHLKRFSQDARGRLSKLNGHVGFRVTIDLRPYIDPRCMGADEYKFRLIGVVEHLGTMRGGHYVAYVRGAKKAEQENGDFVWYHASDAYVREASLEEVLRCEAYILFYEKL